MIRVVLLRLQMFMERYFTLLSTTETKLPELVTLLVTELLKIKRHNPSRSENIGRLIHSYSADLVHGVSRGDTITAKHFLLGLGVHNITGLQS